MRPTRFRGFVIFLLFAISIVNYIDRAAISYSIPHIERDLGLSPSDAGGILGAFGLGYAITTLIGGFVVDRFGSRSVLSIVWVPLWLWFFRDDPAQSRFVNAAELDHIRAGGDDPAIAKKIAPSGVADIRFLLTNRTLLANYWAYFVYGYFLFFFMTGCRAIWSTTLA